MGGMDSIIAEFLAESVENLDQLDQDLVSLEKDPSDREIFTRIFRTIHTIKGTCGFLAFQQLEEVTHVGESLLSRLRDGTLALRPEITTNLLEMIDAVRAILAHIDRTGNEGDEDYSDLVSRLKSFDEEPTADAKGSGGKARATPAKKKKSTPKARSSAQPKEAKPKSKPRAKAPKKPEKPNPPEPKIENTEESDGEVEQLELTSSPAVTESNIRVDVRALDHLMNLVGELVLARNQLVQYLSVSSDSHLVNSSQRLDSVTGELQEAVMRTRMQPISSIWKKLPRFTRDLALKFEKDVEIQLEGEETELDKSVIEAIKGSLLHLVRNAVDHGIESPDERVANGKPRAGTLRLRAHHEGGNVVIEVRDDGRGLDHKKILTRGVKAGLVDEAGAETLKQREIEALIFLPGFSTASTVTNISGRGVGMDVVRANVESMGGSIEIQSEPGESTTFRVKIPLTLAIVSVLLVSAREHRIAIPQASVMELIRLGGEGTELGIEDLNGVPVFRLRGSLLPLVFLDQELGLDDDQGVDQRANIIVLQGDDRRFGLVVKAIEDSQEIVVKPLGRILHGVPFAGATILGDGQIALILDVFRLGLAAGVVSDVRAHTIASEISAAVEETRAPARLLCLQGADDERIALEFAEVSRLERIPRSSIEEAAGQQVMQYGDEILQLIELQQVLPERRKEVRNPPSPVNDETVPIVVCTVNGRQIGLLVHRISDIVEEHLKARRPSSREGVRACAVVQERVTEILDLEAVIRLADPSFFENPDELE
jgi:two-component system chemotaxis sensor kinase CheA